MLLAITIKFISGRSVENRFRWFVYVKRRTIDIIRRVDWM